MSSVYITNKALKASYDSGVRTRRALGGRKMEKTKTEKLFSELDLLLDDLDLKGRIKLFFLSLALIPVAMLLGIYTPMRTMCKLFGRKSKMKRTQKKEVKVTDSILEAMRLLEKHDIYIGAISIPEELADRMKKGRKIVDDSRGEVANEFDAFCDVKLYGEQVVVVKREIGRLYGIKIIIRPNKEEK